MKKGHAVTIKSPKKVRNVLVISSFVLIFSTATLWWFLIHDRTQNTDDQRPSTQTAQSTNVKKQNSSTLIDTNNGTQTNWLNLPELGVRIELPDGLEDIEYVIEQDSFDGHTYAAFSTKTLQQKDGVGTWCTADHSPIGNIHQWDTSTDLSNSAIEPITVENHKYTFNSTQSACSDKNEVLKLQIMQSQLLRSVFDTINKLGD